MEQNDDEMKISFIMKYKKLLVIGLPLALSFVLFVIVIILLVTRPSGNANPKPHTEQETVHDEQAKYDSAKEDKHEEHEKPTKDVKNATTENHEENPVNENHQHEAQENSDIEALKAEVAKLESDVEQEAEKFALKAENAGLKQELEELQLKKSQLLNEKSTIAKAAEGGLSGSKNCVFSGDPAKRKDEVRACLGLGKKTADSEHGSKSGDAHASHEVHWGYEGANGPENWGKLKPDFKLCAKGNRQSPINIESSNDFSQDAPALSFLYKPSPLKLLNNGHTIQVNYAEGSQLKVGDESYSLVQFHFHTPSEEQINGKNFDMVAHLVHKSMDGKLAVVGVMIKKGIENLALKAVFDNMPTTQSSEKVLMEAKVDASKIMPKSKTFYHFEGSLTTPPCTEGVKWFVMKQPITVSEAQFKKFSSIYAFNARPVQSVSGRKIAESF